MAKISGATITVTSKIAGKSVALLSSIMGIRTADIPGWPRSGPSCIPVMLGYQGGPPIGTICSQPMNTYDYDSRGGILYVSTKCGIELAPDGFYTDGDIIYIWDGISFTATDMTCSPPGPR